MKKRNQISNHTEYNRTPEIFKIAASLVPKTKILSFGCSSGLETNSLNDLYFPGAEIHGYDIDKNIIKDNILRNKHSNIKYFDNSDFLSNDYDIIFCMSVLCRWPTGQEDYKFSLFEETLELLDKRLRVNGHLVVYNAQYIFKETSLSTRYVPVETGLVDSGFVTRWDKDFKVIVPANQNVFYKKIENEKNS